MRLSELVARCEGTDPDLLIFMDGRPRLILDADMGMMHTAEGLTEYVELTPERED
jgi:hypothetical protein